VDRLEEKARLLREYGAIPSGLDYNRLWKIEDVVGNTYEYNGVKYNEEAIFDNAQFSIKIVHQLIDKPFWITVFDGATHWSESEQVVMATWKKPDIYSPVWKVDDISLHKNPDFDSKETVAQFIEAFEYLFFKEDESGLYSSGREPLKQENQDIVYDIANDLENLDFLIIDEKINKEKPNIKSIKELGEKYYEVARGNLYQVHIILDNELQELFTNLTEEEAEKLYLQKCHEWYSEGGVNDYQKIYRGEKSMREEDFDEYYCSDQYYESDDRAHVVMEVM